jgi:hypothetical protein
MCARSEGLASPGLGVAGRRMARSKSLSKIDETRAASSRALTEGLEAVGAPSDSPDLTRRSGGLQSLTNDSSSWAPGQRSGVISGVAIFTPSTLIYILVWYVTGALTNSTSKQALQQFPKGEAPWMSLTLMQHLCATLAGTVALRVFRFRCASCPPAALAGCDAPGTSCVGRPLVPPLAPLSPPAPPAGPELSGFVHVLPAPPASAEDTNRCLPPPRRGASTGWCWSTPSAFA